MAFLKGKISANLNALLDTIAFAEGTISNPFTADDGYDIIVTGIDGKEKMTSYADHPFANGRASKVINSKGLTSNAAGRYQQMLRDWPHYKALLKLPDFGPESQDRLAIQHIKECGALDLANDGKFYLVIPKIRNIWASLPGAGYGQREVDLAVLANYFVMRGGAIWEPLESSSAPSSPPLPVSSAPTPSVSEPVKPMPTLPTEKPKPQGLLSLILGLLKRK